MSYKLVYASNGDWVGLYAPDGHLMAEGHSLSEDRMLQVLGINYEYMEIDFEDGTRCEHTFAEMIARNKVEE